jgi:hypothetical protein
MGITQQIGASSIIKPGVVDNTAARPASPYEGQVIYQKDTDEVLAYNGTAWVYPNSNKIAIFQEQYTTGNKPGVANSGGWTKRVLNTTVVNNITGCSIASSVITLTAGTYFVNGISPFYKLDSVQIRLRNTTASTNAALGQSTFIASSVNIMNFAPLVGYFTLTASTNLELQYYVSGASINTNDQGVATSNGSTEVYASLTIQQVS